MSAGRGRRGVERAAFACFVVCMLTASSLAAVYALGGHPQAEGALLGAALLSLGAGLALFGDGLLPKGPYAEERETLRSTGAERAAFDEAFEREGLITRRRLLLGALTGAAGTLLVAFVFPVRSLGPSPGKSLERTPWRRGRRAVTEDGGFVALDDVPIGGLVTVFPEGHVESADGQVVLMRVSKGLVPARGRESWTPQGLIAYSKVCTHAGCPVGLYEVQRQQLLCPCHQSAFDVLRGGEPVFGPAARALPQLPLAIDAEGFVVSQSDFHEPIGPSYWTRP